MFANKIVTRPLLSDAEINQLIFAAPDIEQDNARQLSQRGRTGEQITSIKGSGSDFSEVRAYNFGDDPRHIDWRATARSRVPLVRTYHSEFSQPVCLLIDRRASMRYATRTRLKVTQALRMALWLGGREARCGREISAVLLDSPCQWLPPQAGMRSLRLIAKLANAPCPPIEPDAYEPAHEGALKLQWSKILSGLKQHIPHGSELILITDFFGLRDSDAKMLRMLGQHCSTRAIHVLDASELTPNSSGSLQLQWGKRKRYISGSNKHASEQLSLELQARTKAIARSLNQANIRYSQLSVEQDELAAILPEIQP